jgi:hypothetical protein
VSGASAAKDGVAAALLATGLLFWCGVASSGQAPRIAIIIDDLGYQLAAGQRAVNLPGPVACAVLPETPRAAALAEAAFARGKDVLLHLPLQSMQQSGAAEPGSIHLDMTRREFARAFARSIASVPHAVGISNHQGSLLTQHPGHMRWLMEEIEAQGNLFFVDSYTTHRSIALSLARENGVPAARRDVFLDSDRSPQSLEREFERLKKLSRLHGMAVGIGHPYAATLAFLELELPKLAGEGFELVGIGEYIARQASASNSRMRASLGAPLHAVGKPTQAAR